MELGVQVARIGNISVWWGWGNGSSWSYNYTSIGLAG